MKRALRASAYVVPAVLLSVASVREIAAVSPAPPVSVTGTVQFVPSGAGYVAQGTGFPASSPFLLVVNDADGAVVFEDVVHTNAAGAFSGSPSPTAAARSAVTSTVPLGPCAAPGAVNGGVIFVALADTADCIAATGKPTRQPPPTPTNQPTPVPTPVPPRPTPPPLGTVLAQTATALTATANAKPP
jgi:hypothetical protein